MFHVGNARTLLLNWLVARQSGGSMVLRIEDTDAERSRPEWTEGIVEMMVWLGVDRSQFEGPFFQSSYAADHADDITMGITLVIRAEEHLPNAPKQQLLWSALGQRPPTWAHTPFTDSVRWRRRRRPRSPATAR